MMGLDPSPDPVTVLVTAENGAAVSVQRLHCLPVTQKCISRHPGEGSAKPVDAVPLAQPTAHRQEDFVTPASEVERSSQFPA
jgi:hypothetical protein